MGCKLQAITLAWEPVDGNVTHNHEDDRLDYDKTPYLLAYNH